MSRLNNRKFPYPNFSQRRGWDSFLGRSSNE